MHVTRNTNVNAKRYIYVDLCDCMYRCTLICISVFLRVRMCACMSIYACVCVCVCVCVYKYVFNFVRVCWCKWKVCIYFWYTGVHLRIHKNHSHIDIWPSTHSLRHNSPPKDFNTKGWVDKPASHAEFEYQRSWVQTQVMLTMLMNTPLLPRFSAA